MPLYEYVCPRCQHEPEERFRNLSDERPELCQHCGRVMNRVHSTTGTVSPPEKVKDPGPGRRPVWV